MTTGPTTNFLLIYRLDTRALLIQEFGADERAAAYAYTAQEHEYWEQPTVEVVWSAPIRSRRSRRRIRTTSMAETCELVADFERELAEVIQRRPAA